MTQLQRNAARCDVDLSDAHARQTLLPASRAALMEAFHGLTNGGRQPVGELTAYFSEGLARHTGQSGAPSHTQVVYSASIALSVAARVVRSSARRRVGVLDPTVDSVPAHFVAAGLAVAAVPEEALLPECDLARLEAMSLDALVVVTPNNPTGHRLGPEAMAGLLEWAARREVLLVLDLSFRMLDPASRSDLVAAAELAGAQALVIDDTGKTVAVNGSKLATIEATDSLRASMFRASSDYLLSVAEQDLLLIGTVLHQHGSDNEVARASALAGENLRSLNARLLAVGLPIADAGGRPPLSVARLRCDGDVHRDQVVRSCLERSVAVTSGRHFHWSPEREEGAPQVRVALLRDPDYFDAGATILVDAMGEALSH